MKTQPHSDAYALAATLLTHGATVPLVRHLTRLRERAICEIKRTVTAKDHHPTPETATAFERRFRDHLADGETDLEALVAAIDETGYPAPLAYASAKEIVCLT